MNDPCTPRQVRLRFGTDAWAEKILDEISCTGLGQIAYRVANQDVFRRLIVAAARRRDMRVNTVKDYFGDFSLAVHDAHSESGRAATREMRAFHAWLERIGPRPKVARQETASDYPGVEPPAEVEER